MDSVTMGNLAFGFLLLCGVYCVVLSTVDYIKRRRRRRASHFNVDDVVVLSDGREAKVLDILDDGAVVAVNQTVPEWAREASRG